METPKKESAPYWCPSNFQVAVNEDEPADVIGRLNLSQTAAATRLSKDNMRSDQVAEEFAKIVREQHIGLEARIDVLESRLLQHIDSLVGVAVTQNEKEIQTPKLDVPMELPSAARIFKCRSTWEHPPADAYENTPTSTNGPPRSSSSLESGKKKTLKTQMSVWDYEEIRDAQTGTRQIEEVNEEKKAVIATTKRRVMKWVVHPHAKQCIIWDSMSLVFIAYDTIAIPLFMAFPLPHVTLTIAMFWLSLIFWTLDILFTFFRGYYRGTRLEVRPSFIACRYLHTWLPLDLCFVGIEWMMLCAGIDPTETDGNPNQMHRLARVGKATLRIARLLRLLRVIKLRTLWNEVQDLINSEFTMIALTVIKLIVIILVVAHVIACSWYALGRSTPDGWVFQCGFDESEPVMHSYLVSLHWSLAQFTPAGNELQPYTLMERLFAVVVLVTGLIISALLISSITAAMSELAKLHSRDTKELTQLRRYLRQRDIPWHLAARIRKYSEFVVNLRSRQIQEKDVDLLKYISVPLQKSLAFAICRKTLAIHHMFIEYGRTDLAAFQTVCQVATQSMLLAKGDVLFTARQKAMQMYFVKRGALCYQCQHGSTSRLSLLGSSAPENTLQRQPQGSEETIGPSDWFSEAVLWTDWHHMGTVTTKTVCDIVSVSAEKFAEITMGHKEVEMMCARYARAFVKRLNELSTDVLTDLPVPEFGVRVS